MNYYEGGARCGCSGTSRSSHRKLISMYSMEFFNKCNITHPDVLVQGLTKRCRGFLLGIQIRDDRAFEFPFTSKRLITYKKDQKWGPPTYNGGAPRSATSVSAEGSADTEAIDSASSNNTSGLYLGQPTSKEELAAIRESAIRSNLLRKLSDANVYGRHIQRQLQEKEDALLKCKAELAIMDTELQALVSLAQEVASQGVKPGTRKINGRYVQSHLAIRLEELQERLHLQVKDVEAVCYRDVDLVWYGMAEDVQVMGSFDGWMRGFQLSPEVAGAFTKFSAMVKLRPGRYQVKFLVDGEWHLSPELPSVGEGPTVNNLLVVE